MPIPPPTPAVPFDTVEWAMNSARTKINDCPLALSGNLLSDIQPYSQQFANDGWRQFQRDLANYGEPACTETALLLSFPPVANIDPATQVYVGHADYFDGQNFWVPPNVSLLPADLICPLNLQERLGGSLNRFTPMTPCDDGLPLLPKTTLFRYWEWRSAGPGNGNAIFMPGATVARDIFLRYASFLPDFVNNWPIGATQWYGQPIPILRVADILGFYIAGAFTFSRGSAQAKEVANSFWSEGKTAMRQNINSTTMKIRHRINHRRKPYAAGRHAGWTNW